MNILFAAPYLPSPIRVRPFELLRELRRRDHRVVLAAVVTSAAQERDLARLVAHGIEVHTVRVGTGRVLLNCIRALVSARPLQAEVARPARLNRRLEELLRRPVDLAHVEHLRGAPYLEALRRRLPAGVPLVWDSVDCISHLFAQALEHSASARGRLQARVDLRRTRRHEAYLLAQADRVLVASELDRAALARLAEEENASPAPIDVLTNGVDLERFSPPAAPRDDATVVLSGKMSYHANVSAAVWLVQEVMPRVWAERPEVRVRVVGRAPPAQVRRLAGGGSGRVTVVGEVEEMAAELGRATVAAAPIRYGAGVQNKVLEAMACATPVVASPIAASALAARPGVELEVADEPGSFAHVLLSLLADARRGHALGSAGRRYVEREHRWSKIADRLEESYRLALDERTAGAVGWR